MEKQLKERLIGAAVLVMLAVIFIPMVLDDSADTNVAITETNIPERPEDNFNSRIVPISETDLTPIKVEPRIKEDVPLKDQSTLDVVQAEVEPETEAKPESVPDVAMPAPETVVENNKQASDTSSKITDSKQMGATAWVVQLGSFSSEANASGLNDKLKNAGFPSFVEPLKRGTSMVYRVRVGPELLRTDAQKVQKKLMDSLKLEGIVVRYP